MAHVENMILWMENIDLWDLLSVQSSKPVGISKWHTCIGLLTCIFGISVIFLLEPDWCNSADKHNQIETMQLWSAIIINFMKQHYISLTEPCLLSSRCKHNEIQYARKWLQLQWLQSIMKINTTLNWQWLWWDFNGKWQQSNRLQWLQSLQRRLISTAWTNAMTAGLT